MNEFMPDPKSSEDIILEQRVANLEQAVLHLIERGIAVNAAIEGGYDALTYIVEQIILLAEQPHTLSSVLQKLLDEGVPTEAPTEQGAES